MAIKTVSEARLSINKSYKGDSLSATLNVSYSTDLVGLGAGREYAEVELPADIADFMLALKADGAFEVAYAEPPPPPPEPELEAGD